MISPSDYLQNTHVVNAILQKYFDGRETEVLKEK